MAQPTTNSNQLRVLQVIVLAFASGLVAFTLLALVLGPQTRQPAGNASAAPQDLSQVLLMALGAVGFTTFLILGLFIRPMMLKSAARAWQDRATTGDEPAALQLWKFFQARTIISGAMIEGIGLFASVIFLLTGTVSALGATALSLAGLLWILPTTKKWEQFVRQATA